MTSTHNCQRMHTSRSEAHPRNERWEAHTLGMINLAAFILGSSGSDAYTRDANPRRDRKHDQRHRPIGCGPGRTRLAKDALARGPQKYLARPSLLPPILDPCTPPSPQGTTQRLAKPGLTTKTAPQEDAQKKGGKRQKNAKAIARKIHIPNEAQTTLTKHNIPRVPAVHALEHRLEVLPALEMARALRLRLAVRVARAVVGEALRVADGAGALGGGLV